MTQQQFYKICEPKRCEYSVFVSFSGEANSVLSYSSSCVCGREVGGGMSLLINILQVNSGNAWRGRGMSVPCAVLAQVCMLVGLKTKKIELGVGLIGGALV